MRTQVWWLVIGLAGCESSITRVGPGTASDSQAPPGTDTGEAGGGWACDKRAFDGTCDRLTGDGWDQVNAEQSCGDGLLSTDNCPTSDIGGCTLNVGAPLEYTKWYYQGAFFAASDGADLMQDCNLSFGVWLQ